MTRFTNQTCFKRSCRTFTNRGLAPQTMLCFHFSAQALVLPRLRCAFTLPLRLCFHRIQERQECTSHHLLSLPAAAPSSQTLQNNTPSDVYIPCCNINVMSHRACKSSTDAAADYSCRLLLIQSARLIWGTGKPSMLMHNTQAPAALGVGQQLHM